MANGFKLEGWGFERVPVSGLPCLTSVETGHVTLPAHQCVMIHWSMANQEIAPKIWNLGVSIGDSLCMHHEMDHWLCDWSCLQIPSMKVRLKACDSQAQPSNPTFGFPGMASPHLESSVSITFRGQAWVTLLAKIIRSHTNVNLGNSMDLEEWRQVAVTIFFFFLFSFIEVNWQNYKILALQFVLIYVCIVERFHQVN